MAFNNLFIVIVLIFDSKLFAFVINLHIKKNFPVTLFRGPKAAIYNPEKKDTEAAYDSWKGGDGLK
jgi:hypothetical protein